MAVFGGVHARMRSSLPRPGVVVAAAAAAAAVDAALLAPAAGPKEVEEAVRSPAQSSHQYRLLLGVPATHVQKRVVAAWLILTGLWGTHKRALKRAASM